MHPAPAQPRKAPNQEVGATNQGWLKTTARRTSSMKKVVVGSSSSNTTCRRLRRRTAAAAATAALLLLVALNTSSASILLFNLSPCHCQRGSGRSSARAPRHLVSLRALRAIILRCQQRGLSRQPRLVLGQPLLPLVPLPPPGASRRPLAQQPPRHAAAGVAAARTRRKAARVRRRAAAASQRGGSTPLFSVPPFPASRPAAPWPGSALCTTGARPLGFRPAGGARACSKARLHHEQERERGGTFPS